jgi:hypothetical protein
MTEVWKSDLDHGPQIVALALADWANDDGTSIFPSLAHVAWKTGYSERQVRRFMREFEEAGALVLVAEARDHRPREYRMDVSVFSKKESFVPGGHSVLPPGGTSETDRADTAMSAEPSVEPSSEIERACKDGEIRSVWEHYHQFHPRMDLTPARRRVVVEALAVRTVEECCRAVDAQVANPFYANYQDIKYALKGGKIGDHPDATIDRMIGFFSQSGKTPEREPWQVKADRDAAVENERLRPLTQEQLDLRARRQAARDEDDRRWTEMRDADLEEAAERLLEPSTGGVVV